MAALRGFYLATQEAFDGLSCGAALKAISAAMGSEAVSGARIAAMWLGQVLSVKFEARSERHSADELSVPWRGRRP